MYVANLYHYVQKYSTSGTYSTQWGGYGTGNSNFRYVHGIGSDSSGNIYVADFYNHAIKKFVGIVKGYFEEQETGELGEQLKTPALFRGFV